MNPTLSERARRRSKQFYWRVHPPTPFGMTAEQPSSLIANGGAGTPAPAGTPEPGAARTLNPDSPQRLLLELLLVFLDGWFALAELLNPWLARLAARARLKASLPLLALAQFAPCGAALSNQRVGLLGPGPAGPGLPPGPLGPGPAPGAPRLEPAGCPAAGPGPGR